MFEFIDDGAVDNSAYELPETIEQYEELFGDSEV